MDPNNQTNYALIEEFTKLLLALTPTELTTSYCETCYLRLEVPAPCWPTSPFQEDKCYCINCNRYDYVSNPYIIPLLNFNRLTLENQRVRVENLRYIRDETNEVIRDWLIPSGYLQFRNNERYHKETPAASWFRYGRQRSKQACRSFLSETSKAQLLRFYSLCYSLERFETAPIDEPQLINPLDTLDSFSIPAEATHPPVLDEVAGADPPTVDKPMANSPIRLIGRISTFDRVKAFVASIL